MPLEPGEEMTLDRAWELYFDSKDEQAREFILLAYTPLVDRIARDIIRKKPSNFERQDLSQAGMIGLMNAIERYRPDRGASFPTFASLRVRGAIFDEINGMDWTPRLVRERIKLVIRATEQHFQENQHQPSAEEISSIVSDKFEKSMTPEQVLQAQQQAAKTYVHAVDNSTAIEQEESTSNFSPQGTSVKGVEDTVSNQFFNEYFRELVSQVCTTEERYVLQEVYYNERSMRSIAEEMQVPVSRVSEWRRKAVRKIKAELKSQGLTSYDKLL